MDYAAIMVQRSAYLTLCVEIFVHDEGLKFGARGRTEILVQNNETLPNLPLSTFDYLRSSTEIKTRVVLIDMSGCLMGFVTWCREEWIWLAGCMEQ